MKINYNWLQDYIEEKLPDPQVLAEKIIFGAFEVEDIEEITTETVLDIKVLPDRAHDCLSHYGIAKEVAGLLGLHLKPLTFKEHTEAESDIKVTLETPLCRRYIARKIFDVKIGPSPEWLQTRLESIGQRSINNIVDATNYVMFSLGQPIHAFDYDKLTNGHLIVRYAHEGEPLTTLDDKILFLGSEMMVIADERHALALAGIKGGKVAEVDEHTKNIVIEVANFNPIMVRTTAKKIGIQTDSSKRFENELSPHVAGIAIHAITDLITELAGGQPEDPVDVYTEVQHPRTVSFTQQFIEQSLGTQISVENISEILDRYGYQHQISDGAFSVTIPYERLDIVGPEDMIEEIGRPFGYDKIEPRIPSLTFTPSTNSFFIEMQAVRNDLVKKGYSEVQTYSFRKKGDFEVARGAVGKSALRKNLTDGISESYELNKRNAALLGLEEIKIFEIGTVFPKSGEEVHVAYADKKGITELSLKDYIAKNSVSPTDSSASSQETSGKKFKMWSEYPFITRDISMWVPTITDALEVSQLIHEAKNDASQSFHMSIYQFDTFTKEGRTSIAFRLVFQSFERTLTNEEIDKVMENITKEVQQRGWEVR